MIERHFLLPVTLAAALHGALFFGVPISPPCRPPSKPPVEPVPTIRISPLPEDPEPLDPMSEPGAPASSEGFRPTIEDTPRVAAIADITIPVVKTPGVDIPGVTNLIPPGCGIAPGDGTAIAVGNLVSQADLDSPPRTRVQTSPTYPFDAKRDGRTGQVVIEFVVDETGRVLEPRVIESTDRVFEEPSLRAVSKWRFEPGRSHGRIVRFRMMVPVVFHLGEQG